MIIGVVVVFGLLAFQPTYNRRAAKPGPDGSCWLRTSHRTPQPHLPLEVENTS